MPRTYKKLPGSRNYSNYTAEQLDCALESIRKGETSCRGASIRYNIPASTLRNKLQSRHEKNVGGQKIFNTEEEVMFVTHILKMSEFGFPVNTFNLRCIVKFYLDKNERIIPKFKNNMPGEDWANLFFKRHDILTLIRNCGNVRKARNTVTVADINEYLKEALNPS